MIDSVKLMIPVEELPENYKLTLKNLLKYQEILKENGQINFRGWIDNMWITATNRNLIITGSLTRYALGDNLRHAEKSQLIDAVIDLSDKLKTDLLQAPVKRVDIAGNLRTIKPVNQYYNFLVDLIGFDRNELQHGLVFQNKNNGKYVHFYNKIQHMKEDRRGKKDGDFFDQNILRFETKFFSEGVNRLLKTRNPTMSNVFENYDLFILEWFNTFSSITKKSDVLELPPAIFTERNEWDRYWEIKGIEDKGGLQSILKIISEAQANGRFTGHKDQASLLKRRMKDLMSKPSLTKPSMLMTELEEKIAMIAAFSHDQLADFVSPEYIEEENKIN
jgi:hypothetical protein